MLDKVKQILKDKAPLILEAFQNGTKEDNFSTLEEIAGAKLPDDFKALYLDSNGFDKEHFANLFYGFPFSSIEVVTSAQEALERDNDKSPLRYADQAINSQYTFGVKRIPIGDDSGTSLLCVDLDPAEGGCYGQVILLDYEMGVALKLNNSILEMVKQFEADLIKDRYSLREDALEDGVHWLKAIREIEPINWFNSPRWQYVNDALKKN